MADYAACGPGRFPDDATSGTAPDPPSVSGPRAQVDRPLAVPVYPGASGSGHVVACYSPLTGTVGLTQ